MVGAKLSRWVVQERLRLPRTLCVLVLICPAAARSQSLDAAVSAQLAAVDGVGQCALLIGADRSTPPTYLRGELFQICTLRGGRSPITGPGPSVSTGGGAATPTSLPGIVQQRVAEARKRKPKVTAAGDDSDSSFNVSVTVQHERAARRITELEDGYQSSSSGVTVFADTNLTDRWVGGLALMLARQTLDFDGGGNSRTNSRGVTGYAIFRPDDGQWLGLYVDRGWLSSRRDRAGSFAQYWLGTVFLASLPGQQTADYSSHDIGFGVSAGLEQRTGPVSITPIAAIDWKHQRVPAYTESGGTGLELAFDPASRTSLRSALGLRLATAVPALNWMLEPYASAQWDHEFRDDARTLSVSFADDTRATRFSYRTDGPDRNWGEFGLGIVAVSPGGTQLFAGFRTTVGQSILRSNAVAIGLRMPL